MTIKLYWCRGKGRSDASKQNFGDYLSPLLVEMLAHKPVVYAPVHKAQMIAVGSIMNREKKAKGWFLPHELHVWGAGTDAPGLSFSRRHHYHAVRGVHTAAQIEKAPALSPALGDPGILASHWWGSRAHPDKRYRIGLIPHYVDQENPHVSRAATLPGVLLINVFWPVEEVLAAIQSCDFVLSSSMHGLIVADAFGVPNRRVTLSQGLISDYKFTDYYSAYGLAEPPPVTAAELVSVCSDDPAWLESEYMRPGLQELQAGLINAFPSDI